jgi:RNA polymerase sigma-70 factor (ECF subfamily)
MRLFDKITAEKICSGDVQSFENLMNSYKDKVFNYCYRFCNDYQYAEELTQEIFVTIYKKIRLYDWQKSSLSTWIYTITHNTCINSVRTHNPETPMEEINIENMTQACATEDVILKEELLDKLKTSIQSLEPEERSLVIMKDYYGLKFKEISRITNLPVGTLKSRLHTSRKKIRTLLGDLYD